MGAFTMKEHNGMPFDRISVQIVFLQIFKSFIAIGTGEAVHGLLFQNNQVRYPSSYLNVMATIPFTCLVAWALKYSHLSSQMPLFAGPLKICKTATYIRHFCWIFLPLGLLDLGYIPIFQLIFSA